MTLNYDDDMVVTTTEFLSPRCRCKKQHERIELQIKAATIWIRRRERERSTEVFFIVHVLNCGGKNKVHKLLKVLAIDKFNVETEVHVAK